MTLRVLRMVEERFHRDTEGRPLREGRTPAEFLKAGEIEYKTCPHAGARFQHRNPMNVSALRQMSAHWDEILDATALIRRAYGEARGSSGPDVHDVWRMSQLGACLPWFFVLNDRPLPVYAAALNKIMLGAGIWAQKEIVLRFRKESTTVTAAEIVATSEGNGTLIGETEVCSAGDKMIEKFFEVLVAKEPAFVGLGEVAALVPQREAWLAFGDHYIGFKQVVWQYCMARRMLYRDLIASGRKLDTDELLPDWAEPPEYFLLEPKDPEQLPPKLRYEWFRELAGLHMPFTGGGNRWIEPLELMARAMGEGGATAETFAKLDRAFQLAVTIIERGLHGGEGDDEWDGKVDPAIDASVRDRIAPVPRELFT